MSPSDPPDLPQDFAAECRLRFAAFLTQHATGKPTLILCHSDADGLAAGAILGRALRGQAEVMTTGKGGNAWAPA